MFFLSTIYSSLTRSVPFTPGSTLVSPGSSRLEVYVTVVDGECVFYPRVEGSRTPERSE